MAPNIHSTKCAATTGVILSLTPALNFVRSSRSLGAFAFVYGTLFNAVRLPKYKRFLFSRVGFTHILLMGISFD